MRQSGRISCADGGIIAIYFQQHDCSEETQPNLSHGKLTVSPTSLTLPAWAYSPNSKSRRQKMKTLFNRYAVVLLVLVLLGAGTLLSQNEHASGTGVEGTYLVNVTPGPGGPPPFPALFTLSAGGAIVETE